MSRKTIDNLTIITIVWLMGLISGLLLMITTSTLNFWLAKNQINLVSISLFSLISLPYAINFLWAPLLDSVKLPIISDIFGFKQSWILLISSIIIIIISYLGALNPSQHLLYIACASLAVAFLSSCLDIVFGAIRSEIMTNKYDSIYGSIASFYLFGYRAGMIISKSGVIYLSSILAWNNIFNLISLLLSILIIIMVYHLPPSLITKPVNEQATPTTISNFFKQILVSIGDKKFILLILLFLVLYRLPDNILTVMINPYFIFKGFSEVEIAIQGYLCGSISAIIGGIIGGIIIDKIGIYRSLIYFGIMHAFSHLSFNLLEILAAKVYLISLIVCLEGITGGMAMVAYIALITSLCRGKYRGTQHSLFSAMMGVSRAIIPSLAGVLVLNFGWNMFFILMVVLSIPSLYIAKRFLHKKI